jgi:hypothetical protein
LRNYFIYIIPHDAAGRADRNLYLCAAHAAWYTVPGGFRIEEYIAPRKGRP